MAVYVDRFAVRRASLLCMTGVTTHGRLHALNSCLPEFINVSSTSSRGASRPGGAKAICLRLGRNARVYELYQVGLDGRFSI